MSFLSGDTTPGNTIEMQMRYDLIVQRQEWYSVIRRLIAQVFGAEAAARATPGPDFHHARSMHVPVSLLVDGYLLAAEEVPDGKHRLIAACSNLHYGAIGLWTDVSRPANLKAAIRSFEGWSPALPESGGVILAVPAQTIVDYQSWNFGFTSDTVCDPPEDAGCDVEA